MTDNATPLQRDDWQRIADTIARRQELWAGEDLETSVMVVLANAGGQFVTVRCIAGEYEGTKGELSEIRRAMGLPVGEIPKCPNGHVLFETSEQPVLGWIRR